MTFGEAKMRRQNAALCAGVLMVIACCVAMAARNASGATNTDEAKIRAVLDTQVDAWNRGDVDTFMAGYWKSDQLEFVGASGVTRGYDSVLDRYKKGYPDKTAMGKLSFADLEIHVECANSAYVVGKFQLVREKDSPYGYFTLNFRKFADRWKIIVDHTTAAPAKTP
jgi:ketosteroid isomerase-like protein